MEVRYLTEATSAEDRDWLYIQKPDGLPRKIKKSNLILPQPQIIVTSIVPPLNPQLGMMWNELDTDNNFIQQWTYIKVASSNAWASTLITKDFYINNQSGNATKIFDYRYNYFIRDFVSLCFATTAMAVNQSWSFRFGVGTINDFFISGVNRLATPNFSNQLANTTVTKVDKINRLIITPLISNSTPNVYLIGTQGVSSNYSPSYSSCFMTYQLVRK